MYYNKEKKIGVNHFRITSKYSRAICCFGSKKNQASLCSRQLKVP